MKNVLLKYRPDAEPEKPADTVPTRDQVAEENTWELQPLFETPEAWEAGFARVDGLVEPLEAMRGTLNSAEAIAAMYVEEEPLDRLLERLYTYAHLRADEDTSHTDNQAREARIRSTYSEVGGRLAWITPEILANDLSELEAWAESETLKPFRYSMRQLLRQKPHILTDKEETLLSKAGEIFGGAHKTFSLLTNADITFPRIEDEEGQTVDMSDERYSVFLKSTERRVRKDAFDAMYKTYGSFKNALSSTLTTSVKLHNYNAEIRGYDSALHAALHGNQVPTALYEGLIEATHARLPAFHEYTELRREQLGLEGLDMYDMYVPIVPDYQMTVSFEQAREWVVESCRPLGDEYVEVLDRSFEERWMDIYENKGKRSGAYSSGCYDAHPYVLLNYQATLNDVFTVAHELGHAMHSWLANRAQPYRYAHYPIFIAEIASTLNEALLQHYLVEKADDPKLKAYLLNHYCDGFKGTVYRQTMFAEYEKMVHEMDAAGTPLTPDALSEAYYALNAKNFGSKVEADKQIALEWSRIPHFYYNFYVYKYATSFCASSIFVGRILEGEEKREQYLNLLRAGGSADPLDLIREAGVDLEDTQTLEGAFEGFARTVEELRGVLKAL